MAAINPQDVLLNVSYLLCLVGLILVIWGTTESDRFAKRYPAFNDPDSLDALAKHSRSEIDRGRMFFGVILTILFLSVIEMVSTYSMTGARGTHATGPLMCVGCLLFMSIPRQVSTKLKIATSPVEGEETLHEEFDRILEEWWKKSLPSWPHRFLLQLAAITNASISPLKKLLLFTLATVDVFLMFVLVIAVGMAITSNGNPIFVTIGLVLLVLKCVFIYVRQRTAPPKRPFAEELHDFRTWASKALPARKLTPVSSPGSVATPPQAPSADRQWFRYSAAVGVVLPLFYLLPFLAQGFADPNKFAGSSTPLMIISRIVPLLFAIPLAIYGLNLKKTSPPPLYGQIALIAICLTTLPVIVLLSIAACSAAFYFMTTFVPHR